MHQILVYADSLTCGIIPNTRQRLPFDARWPGVMEGALAKAGAEEKCVGLAQAYEQVAKELGCRFFNAGDVATSSVVDGVHLDAEQHLLLGRELARIVSTVLSER